MTENEGIISQVIGPVVDVHFETVSESLRLPGIHESLKVDHGDGRRPW